MPTTAYFGFTYITPGDPAYADAWGTPYNTLHTNWDAVTGRMMCSGEIRYPEASDYKLILNSRCAFNVDSATFKTDAGTITANLKINSTSVTSLSAVAVTSTEASTAATAAYTAAIGDDLVLTLSSRSGVAKLEYNIWLDRTSAGTA